MIFIKLYLFSYFLHFIYKTLKRIWYDKDIIKRGITYGT